MGVYMTCLVPNTMYHTEDGTYTFNSNIGFNPFSIPCGQCLGCRIDHSRDWALRCMHHAKKYEKNCFITLTFNEENLKDRKSVNVEDFQSFMKRLRENLQRKKGKKIQYFHSTEYGSKKSRPHHHAIIFNYFPEDAEEYKNVGGNIYYTSKELSDAWNNQGYIVVGALSYQTAAYTASYTFKKLRGRDYPEGIRPEKMTCSHGIGLDHFLKYYKEYCQLGYIIFDEKRYRIPRAYLKKLNPSFQELTDKYEAGKISLEKFKETWVDYEERKKWYDKLKMDREFNARESNILDQYKAYKHLVNNQQKYKKKLCEDTPLSEDNRYLKQLKCLELQIMELTGEYNPQKKEFLHETILGL